MLVWFGEMFRTYGHTGHKGLIEEVSPSPGGEVQDLFS